MQTAGKWGTSHYGDRRDGPFGYRNYTIIYAIDCPEFNRVKFGRTLDIDRRFGVPSNVTWGVT